MYGENKRKLSLWRQPAASSKRVLIVGPKGSGKSSLLAAIVAYMGGRTEPLGQGSLEELVPAQAPFDHANVVEVKAGTSGTKNLMFCELEVAFSWFGEYQGAKPVTSLIFCVDHAM